MRRATHKPETESGGPAIITSRGSRSTARKQKSGLETSEEKNEASGHLPAAQSNKNVQKPALGAEVSDPDVGAELSYGFEFEANTGFGTVGGEVRIAAEKEKARLDLELEKEGEEEDAVKLFDAAFKTGLSEEGFKNSIEASVLSADVAEIELYKGVKVAINVSALNAEIEDEEEAFSLFKIEGEIEGKIEDPEQIKGTWMDTQAVRTLLSRGYSLGFSGSLSYTINDAAELKRIRDFIALRRKLAPLVSKLEGALKEVDRLKAKHLEYVAEQTKKFMEKNGIKQYADMTRKQHKMLKAFLKKNPVIKKMKVSIVTAKKTVRTTAKAIKPIVSKMKFLSKGMKSVAGKVAAKVGLKVVSKLLLKAIPVINVISAVLDIITLIRFYNVTSVGGDGESPDFWDPVPEKRPEGGEASADSKESGGATPGEKGKDGKESGAEGKEKVPGETTDASKGGKNEGEIDGAGGENKEGQGNKPEGTEANGPGADVAKALEAESGDGTNKEVLSGDCEKQQETESDAGKSSETESKSETKEEEGLTKEEKEPEKSGGTSKGGEKKEEKEESDNEVHRSSGKILSEEPKHNPTNNYVVNFIWPDKLYPNTQIQVTVTGYARDTGQEFIHTGVKVTIIAADSKTVKFKITTYQEYTVNDGPNGIVYYIKDKELVKDR